jgi:hypothetical protein
MFVHLAKDVINGFKMIVLSGKERHSYRARMRFFSGGTILVSITLFALYASIVYNKATATGEYFVGWLLDDSPSRFTYLTLFSFINFRQLRQHN